MEKRLETNITEISRRSANGDASTDYNEDIEDELANDSNSDELISRRRTVTSENCKN